MATRAQPIADWRRPGPISPLGLGIATGLLALAAAAIGALISVAGRGSTGTGADIVHVAMFTAMQACLSALLSLALGLPVARACWRRASSWRAAWLVPFSFLPVVMPTTVAAAGLIAVWGQRGFVSEGLTFLGLDGLPPIYGLGAVLLAHVFFNAPLMLRVLYGALASIPAAQWRLSAQWGLSEWDRFRLVEWPVLRPVIPGLLALVFLLCFTSFSLILMLGGGPAVTTLEVNIYTALRFDFDMALAGKLALVQLVICGLVVIMLTRLTGRSWAATPRSVSAALEQSGEATWRCRITDGGALALFVIITMLPVIAILARGAGPHLFTVTSWPAFHQSAITSVLIAIASGSVATGLALVLASARTRRTAAALSVWPLDLSISLYLSVSAIVLGTGLFILLRSVADVFVLAPLLVMLGNMLIALPFAYRILTGRLAALAATHDRLCAGLGLRGWRRLRLVTLPAITQELGFAAGLSAALSLGDMTIVALFGSQQFQTLPWLLYQTMARYRAGEAAALSLWLLGLTFLLFLAFTLAARILRRRRHA
ncbi:ABC transporter permease subunit [Alphaproteobacteria bacterium LSUCC0719]